MMLLYSGVRGNPFPLHAFVKNSMEERVNSDVVWLSLVAGNISIYLLIIYFHDVYFLRNIGSANTLPRGENSWKKG